MTDRKLGDKVLKGLTVVGPIAALIIPVVVCPPVVGLCILGTTVGATVGGGLLRTGIYKGFNVLGDKVDEWQEKKKQKNSESTKLQTEITPTEQDDPDFKVLALGDYDDQQDFDQTN